MEVKEKSKKRELIKTIAILFLVVLLALTFFSNTIMNRSLPEVATQPITSGTINAKIRGSGTVAANESYEVTVNQTREVRSVCVQVGDTVSQGDLLFVLGDMESSELSAAQEQLDSLNLQYQEQLLNLSKEYAGDDLTVQRLREDLTKAAAQRDANLVTDTEISEAKGDLAAAQANLRQIGRTLEELQAEQADNGVYSAAQAEVSNWESTVQSAESAVADAENAVKTAQNTVKDYEDQLAKLEVTGQVDSQRSIEDAEEALSQAQYTWRSQWMAYREDLGALVELVWDAGSLSLSRPNTSGSSPQTIGNEQQVYIEAYLTKNSASASAKAETEDGTEDGSDAGEIQSGIIARGKTAYYALIDAQEAVAARERTLERLEEDAAALSGDAKKDQMALESKLSGAEGEVTAAQRALTTAQLDLTAARNGLLAAQTALAQAESGSTALSQQIKEVEAAQREQSALVEALNQTLTDLEAKKTAYDAAVELVDSTQRSIEDALSGKEIDKQLDNLDLQSLRSQIEKAQELVDKYTQDTVATEITANVSGLVSAVNVSAGKETTAGAAMAVIDLVDRGYILRIPVTSEQAKQVKVGDAASVTNYYWGNDVEATLESITADPDNPGTGKLLVFRVTGDVDAGATLTLSIGQRSANYDALIPKSALREDTNGYFALVITVKNSPLSNRYIATRVDVQVLAEDDTSAAVSGLSAGDFVITTSSKPVQAGDQVRMVENS